MSLREKKESDSNLAIGVDLLENYKIQSAKEL